jgi:hypothetical protein
MKHPGFGTRRRDTMTVVLQVRHQATCPFCLAPLSGQATVFHRHLALCDPCWCSGARVSRRFWNRVVLLKLADHFTQSANLIFFTPKEHWPSDLALHLALDLRELSPTTANQRERRHRPESPDPKNEPITTR